MQLDLKYICKPKVYLRTGNLGAKQEIWKPTLRRERRPLTPIALKSIIYNKSRNPKINTNYKCGVYTKYWVSAIARNKKERSLIQTAGSKVKKQPLYDLHCKVNSLYV